VTLDLIEKAYVKDSITQAEYTPTCLRLLGQYKSILKNKVVAEAFGDLESFKQRYDVRWIALSDTGYDLTNIL
jgi:ESCRT-I complex subunit VPS28